MVNERPSSKVCCGAHPRISLAPGTIRKESFHFAVVRSDTFESGTLVARTPAEFWNMVRSFLDNHDFAESICLKAKEFARNQLDDNGFPSLDQVLDCVLKGSPKQTSKCS